MHYYEKNIVEIKTEYTNFLINIMAPLVYEGIKSMYDKAIEVEKETEQAVLQGTVNENPGVLKIFQHFLKNIQTLNSQLIEAEYIRIRDSSKHADIFEKLIKATFKSYIVLLTYNASGKECKLINEKYHDKINIKDFIHKVYVETSKILFLNPELFWHQFPTIEQQKNKRESISIIKEAIKEALIKVLPLNDIITEYLKNDYIIETQEMKENKVRQILIEEDQPDKEQKINFFDDNEQLKEDQKDELMDKLNKSVSKLDIIIDDNTKALEENEFNEKMSKFASLDFGGDKKKIYNEQPQIEQKQPQIEQKQPQIEQKEPIIEQKEPIIEQKEPIIEQKQPQIEQKQPEQDINEIKILKSNINEKEYYDALFM